MSKKYIAIISLMIAIVATIYISQKLLQTTTRDDCNKYSNNVTAYNQCIVKQYLNNPKNVKHNFIGRIKFDEIKYSDIPYIECINGIGSKKQLQDCKNMSEIDMENYKYPNIKFIKIKRNLYEVNSNMEFVNRRFEIKGFADVNDDNYLDMVVLVTELDNKIPSEVPIVFTKYMAYGKIVLLNEFVKITPKVIEEEEEKPKDSLLRKMGLEYKGFNKFYEGMYNGEGN